MSNPEFLKEGAAVEDFMRPDRVDVGSDDDSAIHLMRLVYSPFLRNRDGLLVMHRRSEELTKYAANAMLATRISIMNELAILEERIGADIELVRVGIGSDPRIGTQFLYAGCGYGGSCFPKDVKALMHSGAQVGMSLRVLGAVEAVEGAYALVIVTEWKEFRSPDFDHLRRALRQPVVFDGRNLFDPDLLHSEGLEYHCIGRGSAATRHS